VIVALFGAGLRVEDRDGVAVRAPLDDDRDGDVAERHGRDRGRATIAAMSALIPISAVSPMAAHPP
jgi:hypothetical protein